jgi:outer membrane lipoprotein SlyB
MRVRETWIVTFVTVALVVGLSSVSASQTNRADRNVTINITYGKVLEIEQVKLKSKAGQGAALGGIAGLAVAHGDTGDNLAGAAAGAAVGALLSQALTKHKAEAITVQKFDGSTVKVVMDHADVVVGDCVSLEEGRTTNLRRVAPEMCTDGEHHVDEEIRESHVSDAEECHQAKLELLEATEQEAFDRALQKVKILCH